MRAIHPATVALLICSVADLEPVHLLAGVQGGCVSAEQLAELGWGRSRIGQLRRQREWRTLLPGVYLVNALAHPREWVELDVDTRLWAARLMHGADTVFCGETAARLLGIQGLDRDDGTIHLRLAPGNERHQVRGVRIHTQQVDEEDIVTRGAFRLTSPQRTVLDIVLVHRREVAVSALDSALNQRLIQPTDLELMRYAGRGRRGAERAAGWWDLADGRAESPLETRARLVTIAGGVPPDDLQYPVYDGHGVLLGFGDLAWFRPRRRTLILETDGRDVHERPIALFRDRYRANDFLTAGDVDVLRATWRDVDRPAYLLSILRRNLL
jgi:hypothetical protein